MRLWDNMPEPEGVWTRPPELITLVRLRQFPDTLAAEESFGLLPPF